MQFVNPHNTIVQLWSNLIWDMSHVQVRVDCTCVHKVYHVVVCTNQLTLHVHVYNNVYVFRLISFLHQFIPVLVLLTITLPTHGAPVPVVR